MLETGCWMDILNLSVLHEIERIQNFALRQYLVSSIQYRY